MIPRAPSPRLLVAAFAAAALPWFALAASAQDESPRVRPEPSAEGADRDAQARALETLAAAHERFRSEVTRSLFESSSVKERDLDRDHATIASVGDGVVIAGAPRRQPRSVKDASGDRPSANREGEAKRTAPGKVRGVVLVIGSGGLPDATPRSDESASDERAVPSRTPAAGAGEEEDPVSVVIESGVYDVKVGQGRVTLVSCDTGRAAASMPLVSANAPSAGAPPAGATGAAPGEEWPDVFGSIVRVLVTDVRGQAED